DLPTLAGWHKEGRLPAGSQVQAEGSDDWLPVAEVLRNPTTTRPLAAPASGRPTGIIPKPAAKPAAAKFPASPAPRPSAVKPGPDAGAPSSPPDRSEEHTSELQSRLEFVLRLLPVKKNGPMHATG